MAFDPEVKVGEIRIFADTKEPLVALILESRGLAGWRIVPVSPYRVPANERCRRNVRERRSRRCVRLGLAAVD